MQSSQLAGRIAFIDVAKVIVTFLVVFGHLYSPEDESILRRYIYTFHMPFFFYISGMFHKFPQESTPFANVGKYIRTILVPTCFFIAVFILLIPPLFSIIDNGDSYFVALAQAVQIQLAEFLSNTHLYYNQVCWFLICLFWCKVFVDVIHWKKWIGFISLLAVLLLCWKLHCAVLYTLQAVVALPFYIAGKFSKDKLHYVEKVPYKVPVAILLGLFCFGLMLANGRVSLLAHNFGKLPMHLNIVCFYVNALLGSAMIVVFSASFRAVPRFVTNLSQALITVVGMQAVFYHPILHWYDGYNLNIGLKIIIAIAIMIACYLCHLLIMRYVPFVLGRKKV